MTPVSIETLNAMPVDEARRLCGGLFESSPWITDAALEARPFESRSAFHERCMEIVRAAGERAQVDLIRAHPDLVGRLAREGRLGTESTAEQAAAGLDRLSARDVELFETYNARYRERFGFPFVICARRNRKDAILAAFPERLQNDADAEREAALDQIGQIAQLRLSDIVVRGEKDAD